MANKNLSKEKLDQYLVKNGHSYHKYLDKFNNKKWFLSLNLFALFFAPIWMAYRKVWRLYGLLFMFQILIVVFYYLSEHNSAPLYLDNIMRILVLLFAFNSVFLTLFANLNLLGNANHASGDKTARSSLPVVLIATIIFFMPAGALFYISYHPEYVEYKQYVSYLKTTKQKEVEFRIGGLEPGEGLASGVIERTSETVYFQEETFISDEHFTNANLTWANGGPDFIGLELNKEAQAILYAKTKENINKHIIILFDSEPFLVYDIGNEAINTQMLLVPNDMGFMTDGIVAYLGGRGTLNTEYKSFFEWLIHNF